MVKTLSILTAMSAAFLCNTAFTAPVGNLKVAGEIKPPTCTVNGATQSDIIFDYGRISPSLIPTSSVYRYPASLATNTVVIECDANTYLTFVATDTYQNTELNVSENTGNTWFHLVDKLNADKALGATFFVWDNVSVDGSTAYISRANDVAITGATNYRNALYSGTTNGWTSEQQTGVNKAELKLVAGKVFETSFRQGQDTTTNQTFILSKNQLTQRGIDIANGVDFIGEAVLTFNFGV
ncbi:fimbrial protein [Providencia rettgeri]|uniref:fimbrial protein n=1 Tax=Providencia rettgeri TaxID=587 RepID=UPI003D7C4066